MKGRLFVGLLSLLLLYGAPVKAKDSQKEYKLIPTVSPYINTGLGAYRSAACPCFDRGMWNVDIGLNLQWFRFFGIEGEYRYGSMLLGGNFPFTGYAMGLRSGLTPNPTRWWDDFYVRGGWSHLSIMGTRHAGYHGLYLHPGWSVRVFANIHLEAELSTSYFFGAMEHLNLGFRTGIRLAFF